MTRQMALALALAGGIGCSEPTRPTTQVRTRVVGDSVVATISHAGDVDWLRFPLTVAIENRGPATVATVLCPSSIEGYDGANWSTVWSETCFVLADVHPQIASGDIQQFNLDIGAALAGPGDPKWNSPRVDGTYRFRTLVYATDGSANDAPPSNQFILRTE